MTDYLQQLIARKKNSDTPVTLPPKPTKAPFVSSVSTPPSVSKNSPAQIDVVYQALAEIHDRQSATLKGGIARVRLSDWSAACGLNQLEFWRIMQALEQAGRIIREHGYARPGL